MGAEFYTGREFFGPRQAARGAHVRGMRVEVINTGTELLLGMVTNTHLGFLAQGLFGLGLRIERQVTVPDGVAIAEVLEEAMSRAELDRHHGRAGADVGRRDARGGVGGVGLELIFHPEILEGIAAKFAARKFAMNELQRAQAMVPRGGVVLENAFGTAPGLIVQNDKTVAVLLPGPPNELRPMWENGALPWLTRHFASRLTSMDEVTLRLLGIGETRVQLEVEQELLALGPIEIGYCARPGEVDLRLLAADAALLKRAADLARAKLAEFLYAEGAETMEQAVVRLASAAGKTIATAESCTAGWWRGGSRTYRGARRCFAMAG